LQAGVSHIVTYNTISHPTNGINLISSLKDAVQKILSV